MGFVLHQLANDLNPSLVKAALVLVGALFLLDLRLACTDTEAAGQLGRVEQVDLEVRREVRGRARSFKDESYIGLVRGNLAVGLARQVGSGDQCRCQLNQ